MKNYFSKKVFLASASLVLAISLGFIVGAKSEGINPKVALINSMLNAPIEKSFAILSEDIEASKNKVSPFHIVEILEKKD